MRRTRIGKGFAIWVETNIIPFFLFRRDQTLISQFGFRLRERQREMKGRVGVGGSSSGSGSGRGERMKYSNACLTMHQPWASLLVHGIKRVEGRSWPAPLKGRLWIHAASKVPDPETIKAMEDFYRQIYAVDGITDIKFPEHYPVSRLIGCVEVVGCLKCEELVCWEAVPASVRLEGLTDFCWLCENPQKLLVPFEMRGYQRVYNLERRIYEAAVRGLRPVEGPLPVKFPLPDPWDPLSLKPGSLALHFSSSGASSIEKSPSVSAAIAGARAAATQYSKKDQHTSTIKGQPNFDLRHGTAGSSQNISTEEHRREAPFLDGRLHQQHYAPRHVEQLSYQESGETNGQRKVSSSVFSPQSEVPSSKLFAAALKGLHLN